MGSSLILEASHDARSPETSRRALRGAAQSAACDGQFGYAPASLALAGSPGTHGCRGGQQSVHRPETDLSAQSVCKWRQPYLKQGLAVLDDELRPGRPRSISHEQVTRLAHKTLTTKPKDGTHWIVRSIAQQAGPSRTIVHRDTTRGLPFAWAATTAESHGAMEGTHPYSPEVAPAEEGPPRAVSISLPVRAVYLCEIFDGHRYPQPI